MGNVLIRYAALVAVALLAACASLPPPGPDRTVTHAFADTETTRLGEESRGEGIDHPGKTGVLFLDDGVDAYVARAVLAEVAERSLDVQYYLYHADDTGRFLAYQLLRAAERGVRVRILVDDMGMSKRDRSLAAMDAHPNLEIRIFNPFRRDLPRSLQFLTRYSEVNRRMHNKSFTADNQASIIGGRNIGDEYFDADPTLEFGDLDVLAIGPVVGEVSAAFDLYWNSELAYPVDELIEKKPTEETMREMWEELEEFVKQRRDSPYAEAMRNSALAEQIRAGTLGYFWGDAEAVYDQPEKVRKSTHRTELHLSRQFHPYFEEIETELIIISPYFVPGSSGVRYMRGLVERGVRVRILTNSLASTDVSIVHAGYAKYREALVRAGVELYEIDKTLTRAQRKGKKEDKGIGSKASLHAKTFVFDRDTVFVGSLNADPRSNLLNTEIGIVIHAPEMARMMAENFDERIDATTFRLELHTNALGDEVLRWVKGEEVHYSEPHVGFWRGLGVGLLGLLPIESQL